MIDRQPRVGDTPAEHAVADVEEDAEADRHALARELRHLLPFAIVEHLEGVLRQVRDEMAVGVSHRHRDAGDVDAGAKGVRVAYRRLLREGQRAGCRERGEQCEDGTAHKGSLASGHRGDRAPSGRISG
jgi:hypothetical protein